MRRNIQTTLEVRCSAVRPNNTGPNQYAHCSSVFYLVHEENAFRRLSLRRLTWQTAIWVFFRSLHYVPCYRRWYGYRTALSPDGNNFFTPSGI